MPKRMYREIVESKLEDGECGFCPGRSTTYQIFTLKQIFEKSWEYGLDLFACFVDLEKAYDRVPREKLWKVLQEYGVDRESLRAIKLFYCRPEVCARVKASNSSRSLWALDSGKCAFLTSPFYHLHAWIDKCSQANECATMEHCKISRLLFVDDLFLLSFTESGLQRALNHFADACDTAGMKISMAKTEVLHLSKTLISSCCK